MANRNSQPVILLFLFQISRYPDPLLFTSLINLLLGNILAALLGFWI